MLAVALLVGCQDQPTGKRLTIPGVELVDVGRPLDAAVDAAIPDAAREPGEPPQRVVLGTYNVYNLFDLTDDPATDEQEFTPRAGVWDAGRQAERLRLTGQVFASLGADIVVVNEIETREVLELLADAIRAAGGPTYPYLAHVVGRGGRGLDVGLLSRYPVLRELSRPISMEHQCRGEDGPVTLDGSQPEARPMLQADIDLDDDGAADLIVLGNHWKAKGRSWPCSDAEHQLRSGRQLGQVFGMLQGDGIPVVAMGDFNVFEFEPPLKDAVGARLDLSAVGPGDVYNTWGGAGVEEWRGNSNQWNDADNSSYEFDGGWTRLDHILVDGSMRPGGEARWQVVPGSIRTAHFPDMFFRGGPNAWSAEHGGYSDHLPVRVELRYAP